MGDLAAWEAVAVDQALVFDGDPGQANSVLFVVLASGEVEVSALDELGDARLVACGSGRLRVKFTAVGSCQVVFSAAGGEIDPVIFVQRRVDPQLVADRQLPSFTTIEPRGSGPSDELRRMMAFMRINAERREQLLRQELAQLREERARWPEPSAPAVPPQPAPAPSASADEPEG